MNHTVIDIDGFNKLDMDDTYVIIGSDIERVGLKRDDAIKAAHLIIEQYGQKDSDDKPIIDAFKRRISFSEATLYDD